MRLIRAIREKRSLSTPELRRILPRLLALNGDVALKPEEWDKAIDEQLVSRRPIPPADRLLVAAIEAFSRSGYADVNVDELGSRARIAKGSFYQHYPSKEALLFAAAAAAGVRVLQGFHAAAGKRTLLLGSGATPLEGRLTVLFVLVTFWTVLLGSLAHRLALRKRPRGVRA